MSIFRTKLIRAIQIIIIFITISNIALASNNLFFFEIQGITGYSFQDEKFIYRSGMVGDSMQLNSVGFDYIQKFGNYYGDWGTFALQMRLIYNYDQKKFETKLYNAYLKYKTNLGDIWIGNNRPSFGISSYLDTHAELIQPLTMYGISFDKDLGIGFIKDTRNGDFKISLTRGSGDLKFSSDDNKYNFLLATRISKGLLNYDNYTLGLSTMIGKIISTDVHEMNMSTDKKIIMIGLDIAYNFNNIEYKTEFDFGSKNEKYIYASLQRLSLNLLDENKLKIELQYIYKSEENETINESHNSERITENTTNNIWTFASSYKLNADLTIRGMYEYDANTKENKIVAQLYWYHGLFF
jgi:hypothetical protein